MQTYLSGQWSAYRMAVFSNVGQKLAVFITFFIDIFVVFVCIHRYVKLNSGKVGRNSRREATEGYKTSE